jgi:hypothetical protein
MGNCCAGDGEDHNMNVKKTTATGKGKAVGGTQPMESGSFVPSGDITDYCNEKVKGIYTQLEPYTIPTPTDSTKVEKRDMMGLENDGKYVGEWSLVGGKRHGRGI